MRRVSGPRPASGKVLALDSALVRLAANGVRPRCGEASAHELFLSEKPEERALAASWCAGCPVRRECADTGAAIRADFRVWGGRDRTIRPRKAGVGPSLTHPEGASPLDTTQSAPGTPTPDTAGDTAMGSPGDSQTLTRTGAAVVTPAAVSTNPNPPKE